ncbi:MAG: hypothetical protein ACR2QV_09790 [Gammaproteobacteria bacterium]
MSFVQVRDYALWVGDIYGNAALQDRIRALDTGETIELEVEGCRSVWEKLPTRGPQQDQHGVKAAGEARRQWHALRDERFAGIVSIHACDEI